MLSQSKAVCHIDFRTFNPLPLELPIVLSEITLPSDQLSPLDKRQVDLGIVNNDLKWTELIVYFVAFDHPAMIWVAIDWIGIIPVGIGLRVQPISPRRCNR